MRGVRIAFVAVLGLPLAGCYGLIAPKPLPDWAMQPQGAGPVSYSGFSNTSGTRVVAERPARPRRSAVARVEPQGALPDVIPFSAEWNARENAADARLRRQMNICGNC